MIFSRTLVHRTYGAITAAADGGDTPPAATTGSLRASVQRPSNAQMQRLMSSGAYAGRRADDFWFVDTASALFTLGETGGQPADQVDIVDERGVTRAFEVKVSVNCEGPIAHWETLVVRIVEGDQ